MDVGNRYNVGRDSEADKIEGSHFRPHAVEIDQIFQYSYSRNDSDSIPRGCLEPVDSHAINLDKILAITRGVSTP